MPVPDQKAARELGRALRRVGFTDGALDDLLGDDAYSSEPGDMVRHAHTLPTTKLGLVVRLLFLGLPVARHDATHALRDSAVAALARLGLAELGVAEVVPLARVTPVQDLFVASDLHSRGDDDPPDYVAGYTPTTRVCDALTPRRRVRRALDVGTGCGGRSSRRPGRRNGRQSPRARVHRAECRTQRARQHRDKARQLVRSRA
jgi:hypothetical protein